MAPDNHRSRSRSRSRSPYRAFHNTSHRNRSTSPRREHRHHHHRHHHTSSLSKPKHALRPTSPPRPITLPLRATKLSNHDLAAYRPMFSSYLDIQKQIALEDLPEHEVKGRWKSFVNKWYVHPTIPLSTTPLIENTCAKKADQGEEPWRIGRRLVRSRHEAQSR